jgi:peptidoglycan-associated lipoprotein
LVIEITLWHPLRVFCIAQMSVHLSSGAFHMRMTYRSLLAAVALPTLAACATTGALRRAREEQAAALATERAQRISSDSMLAVNDSILRSDLGAVHGDVQALRSELQAMKTEFGAKITAMENAIQFAMPVNFAYDDATVRSQDQPMLDRFAKVVDHYYTGSKVTIEGFADPAGSVAYNLMLSRQRADAVRNYLTSHGLTTAQLATIGYGKSRLVNPGAAREMPGAEQNRRVVFVIESKGQRAVAMAQP